MDRGHMVLPKRTPDGIPLSTMASGPIADRPAQPSSRFGGVSNALSVLFPRWHRQQVREPARCVQHQRPRTHHGEDADTSPTRSDHLSTGPQSEQHDSNQNGSPAGVTSRDWRPAIGGLLHAQVTRSVSDLEWGGIAGTAQRTCVHAARSAPGARTVGVGNRAFTSPTSVRPMRHRCDPGRAADPAGNALPRCRSAIRPSNEKVVRKLGDLRKVCFAAMGCSLGGILAAHW